MNENKRLAEGMGFEPTIGVSTYNGLAIPHIQVKKTSNAAEMLGFCQRKARIRRERQRSIPAQESAQFVRAPFTPSRMEVARG